MSIKWHGINVGSGGKPPASDTNPLVNGTASPGVSEDYSRADHIHPTDTSRAPTSHASSEATYGVGNNTSYGHLKLSNTPNTGYGEANGTAATPKAVADAVAKRVPLIGMGKNLLDNWYFLNPINQRGLTSYTTAGYCINRWRTTGGTVTVDANGVTFSTETQYHTLYQQIEGTWLAGKQVRVSILYGDSLFTQSATWPASGELWINNISSTGFYLSIYTSTSNTAIRISRSASGSASITLKAIKLELGSEQTLAHQESGAWILNEVPDYQYELYKCITSTADSTDIYANKSLYPNVPNKNLLDNWYFGNLVNQRGASSYTGDKYTIDRWRISDLHTSGTVTVNSNSITVSGTSSAAGRILQAIKYPSHLTGKNITLSILVKSYTGSCQFSIGAGLATHIESGIVAGAIENTGVTMVTATLPAITSGRTYLVGVHAQANSSVEVLAIKLELGTQQTLAHSEGSTWVLNEIPDYEEELLKCQTSTADGSDTYANKAVSVNIPNKNQLDNWYFLNPVNQRGSTSYTASGYTIDRWRNYQWQVASPSVSITSDGIRLQSSTASGTANTFSFAQMIPVRLAGKTVTVSLLYSGNTNAQTRFFLWNNGSAVNNPTIPTGSGLWYRTFTIPSSLTNASFQVGLQGSYGGAGPLDITLIAMKVELGTQQTLAHLEGSTWVLNEIPNYGEELVKCQQYLYPVFKGQNDTGIYPIIIRSKTVNGAAQGYARIQIFTPNMLNRSSMTVVNTYSSLRLVVYKRSDSSVPTQANLTYSDIIVGNQAVWITFITSANITSYVTGAYDFEVDTLNGSGYLFLSTEP